MCSRPTRCYCHYYYVYTRTTISHRRFNGFIHYYYYCVSYFLFFQHYRFARTCFVLPPRCRFLMIAINTRRPGTLMVATARIVRVVVVSYRAGIKDARRSITTSVIVRRVSIVIVSFGYRCKNRVSTTVYGHFVVSP